MWRSAWNYSAILRNNFSIKHYTRSLSLSLDFATSWTVQDFTTRKKLRTLVQCRRYKQLKQKANVSVIPYRGRCVYFCCFMWRVTLIIYILLTDIASNIMLTKSMFSLHREIKRVDDTSLCIPPPPFLPWTAIYVNSLTAERLMCIVACMCTDRSFRRCATRRARPRGRPTRREWGRPEGPRRVWRWTRSRARSSWWRRSSRTTNRRRF